MATRLIRAAGDCFRADLVVFRFDAEPRVADFRAADFFCGPEPPDERLDERAEERLADFELLFRFAPPLVFEAVLEREAARFDGPEDLRRAFPPDDFDPVAMMSSSWKVRLGAAQDSRAAMSSMMSNDLRMR